MGSTRIQSLAGTPAALRQQVLDIEEKVGIKPSISLALRNKLFGQLDATRHSMETLQSTSFAVSEFSRAQIEHDLEDLPEKIVELYGRIYNLAVDTEVEKVAKEAKQLETRLKKGDTKAVAQKVTQLKEHIQSIHSRHALGLENRSTVAVAKNVAKRADQFLKAHTLGESIPPLMNQMNLLEIQKYHYGQDEIDGDLSVELFDIAEAFYYGSRREAMKGYHQLPEEIKRLCKDRFAELGVSSPTEDLTATAQALVATAYDLVMGKGKEPVFTPQELEELFREARDSATT
ncbi:MAG: hypothetical protein KGZ39_08275 [Simkania sp.]|nr:hypothetical protein [Simkania sp.]